MAYSIIPIFTKVIGSTPSHITFNNIPQTYSDLLIHISIRGEWSGGFDSLGLYFNGVQSSRSGRHLYTNGTSNSSNTTTYRDIAAIPTQYGTANTFSNTQLYIPGYTSSKYKSFLVESSAENNATATSLGLMAGLWSSSAAITSIAFDTGTSGLPYLQNSSISIYGIKSF